MIERDSNRHGDCFFRRGMQVFGVAAAIGCQGDAATPASRRSPVRANPSRAICFQRPYHSNQRRVDIDTPPGVPVQPPAIVPWTSLPHAKPRGEPPHAGRFRTTVPAEFDSLRGVTTTSRRRRSAELRASIDTGFADVDGTVMMSATVAGLWALAHLLVCLLFPGVSTCEFSRWPRGSLYSEF